MRLIDADELIGNVFKNDISYNAFKNLVQRQPTVDAVKHGEWIWKNDNTLLPRTCSVCNAYFYLGRGWNYCPNCGAKMDGEEDE